MTSPVVRLQHISRISHTRPNQRRNMYQRAILTNSGRACSFPAQRFGQSIQPYSNTKSNLTKTLDPYQILNLRPKNTLQHQKNHQKTPPQKQKEQKGLFPDSSSQGNFQSQNPQNHLANSNPHLKRENERLAKHSPQLYAELNKFQLDDTEKLPRHASYADLFGAKVDADSLPAWPFLNAPKSVPMHQLTEKGLYDTEDERSHYRTTLSFQDIKRAGFLKHSPQEIHFGKWLFGHSLSFVTPLKDVSKMNSIAELYDQHGQDVPEFAFAGRSNVGKSSLINALTNSNLVETSKTPGRTQSINFYKLSKEKSSNPVAFLVDLPGYGYAKAPKEIVKTWQASIREYLTHRSRLTKLLFLIDARIGISKIDREYSNFLDECSVPFQIVLTKVDRVPAKRLHWISGYVEEFALNARMCHPQLLLTSSTERSGLSELKAAMAANSGLHEQFLREGRH